MDNIRPGDISQSLKWNGDEVFNLMIEALTDCNFHTEVMVLTAAWHGMSEAEYQDSKDWPNLVNGAYEAIKQLKVIA